MNTSPPVTQRDLAERCGVHPSTICLALRNSPAIPAATRARIQKIAAESGYRPNVAARNLACMRTEKLPASHLPLAWIDHSAREGFWRTDPTGRRLLGAARRRAEGLGYYLDEHWLHAAHMSAARLAQILRARGVQGVLLPAHAAASAIDAAAWREFSAVVVNGRLGEAGLDEVCPDYFYNLDLALARLGARGARRVGLALPRSFDDASGGLTRSGFLRVRETQAATERIPVCLYTEDNETALEQIVAWERRHGVAVIVGHGLPRGLRALAAETVELRLAAEQADTGGVDERPELVAAAAVERLTAKIRRFERGPSDTAQTLLIRGAWQEAAVAAAVIAA